MTSNIRTCPLPSPTHNSSPTAITVVTRDWLNAMTWEKKKNRHQTDHLENEQTWSNFFGQLKHSFLTLESALMSRLVTSSTLRSMSKVTWSISTTQDDLATGESPRKEIRRVQEKLTINCGRRPLWRQTFQYTKRCTFFWLMLTYGKNEKLTNLHNR